LLAVSGYGARFAVRGGPSAIDLRSTSTLATTATVRVPCRIAPVTAVAWSRNLLAVGGQAGSVELWRVDGRPRLVGTLAGLPQRRGDSDTIEALAFSPDGSVVAATDADQPPGPAPASGRVVLWRVAGGREIAAPRRLGSAGAQLAFSRDGRLLAVGEQGSDVAIVDVRAGGLLRTLHPGGVSNSAVAFAADGTLLTGSLAGTVRRWDVRRGVSVGRPVLVTAAPVQSLRFSPAGDLFATTGGSDGVSKLWSLDPFQQVGANFEGTPGGTGEAAFTSDGRSLLVVYDNGKAFRWPIRPAAWAHQACAVADRNLTREEWSRFVTGRAYAPVCGLQRR